MAIARATARDDRKLERVHLAAVASQAVLSEIRRTKPKEPRAKHVAKAKRINEEGRLPSIAQLSFNGVLEHSGVLEWCEVALALTLTLTPTPTLPLPLTLASTPTPTPALTLTRTRTLTLTLGHGDAPHASVLAAG